MAEVSDRLFPNTHRAALRLLIALFVGGAGGALFSILGLPLPWMLGSMTISAAVAVLGQPWSVSAPLRDVARPVIGVMAGSAFTPAVIQALPDWWSALLLILAYTLVSVVIGFFYFSRVAGFDRVTAFFASAPGGLAELTILGSTYGGNLRKMVLVHSIRIISVLLFLPIILQFLVGYDLNDASTPPHSAPRGTATVLDWGILIGCGVLGYLIGKAFRIPGGVLIPALFLSAFVHATGWTSASPPGWLVAAVQVVIGSAAGARFFGVRRSEVLGALLWGLLWAVALIAFAATMATIAAPALGQPFAALLLAFAPGGTAEMTILAYAIGIEVAFVITCQVSRIMLVYTIAPILFSLFRRKGMVPSDQQRPQDREP